MKHKAEEDDEILIKRSNGCLAHPVLGWLAFLQQNFQPVKQCSNSKWRHSNNIYYSFCLFRRVLFSFRCAWWVHTFCLFRLVCCHFCSIVFVYDFQCVIGVLFRYFTFFLFPRATSTRNKRITRRTWASSREREKSGKEKEKCRLKFRSFFLRLLLCVFVCFFACLPRYSRTNHESVRVFSTSMWKISLLPSSSSSSLDCISKLASSLPALIRLISHIPPASSFSFYFFLIYKDDIHSLRAGSQVVQAM